MNNEHSFYTCMQMFIVSKCRLVIFGLHTHTHTHTIVMRVVNDYHM